MRHCAWIFSICIALLTACGEQLSTPGQVGSLQQVPRNRTLILDCVDAGICAGQMKDYDSFNPYLPGRTARTGFQFLYEPLYFYNAYGKDDNVIPWIATGHEFNEGFTEVVVEIRKGVKWSDGQPWTARYLVSTINLLRANAPKLVFSTDM